MQQPNPKLSIYAVTQGMRACNNNNMRKPKLNNVMIYSPRDYIITVPTYPV